MIITPIGAIPTPYATMEKVPIRPCYSNEVGEVEVFSQYEEGLKDMEDFSHMMI